MVLIAGSSDPLGEGPYTAGYRARQTPTLVPHPVLVFRGYAPSEESLLGRGVNVMENEGLETHLWVGNSARNRDWRQSVRALSLPAMHAGFRTRTWTVGGEGGARGCP